MNSYLFLIARKLCGAMAFALFLTVSAQAQVVKFEWKTCVNMSTLFTTKQGCYVFDTVTREGKIVVELGTGINYSAGGIVIGGGASSLLVVTVEFPASTGSEAAIKDAVKKAEAEFKKTENRPQMLKMYHDSQGRTPQAAPSSWTVSPLSPLPISDLPESIRTKVKRAIPS